MINLYSCTCTCTLHVDDSVYIQRADAIGSFERSNEPWSWSQLANEGL